MNTYTTNVEDKMDDNYFEELINIYLGGICNPVGILCVSYSVCLLAS